MFNEKLAWECALLSKEAYCNSFVQVTMLDHGYYTRAVRFRRHNHECHLFIKNDKSRYVFAFTGTQKDDPRDFLTDAEIKLTKFQSGKVHRGFYNAFENLYDDIYKYIEDNEISIEQTIFAGHSLGGAVATLFFYAIFAGACYTFGSPRVVDKDFINGSRRLKNPKKYDFYRIYNRRDPIPTFPRKKVLFFKRSGYVHAGQPIALGSHGCKKLKYHSIDMYLKELRKLWST